MPASCPRYRDFIIVGVSEKIPRVVRKHEGAGSAQLGPVFKTPTWVSPGFVLFLFFFIVIFGGVIESEHLRSLSESWL